MSNCDELFQQIQSLQQQRQALDESRFVLNSEEVPPDGPPKEENPAQKFVFTDRATGRTVETDFGQMMGIIRGLTDEQQQALITQALGQRAKPVGSEGQFQNFGQLLDRMAFEDAQEAAELVQVLTGSWEKANPADFQLVTKINDKAEFAQRLADSYATAGILLDVDSLAQGIAQDAAPFMSILGKQARLQVFAQVARDNLTKKIEGLTEAITDTGLAPSVEQMKGFTNSAAMGIFAERSAALSRRVSGQLLQQLQNDFSTAPAIAGRAFEESLKKSANDIFGNQEKLVNEQSIIGRVLEAAGRGVDGLKDLAEILESVRRDGIDPDTRLDKDFDHVWRRNARAYYKDSQLFNLNTQVVANYLSNKMVYVAEGYRQVFQNAQLLRGEIKGSGFGRLAKQLLPGNLIKGIESTWQASMLANEVIRDGWKQALGDDAKPGVFGSWQAALDDAMNGRTPFGEAADERGGQTMTIDEQYAAARQVLYGDSGAPASGSTEPGWSLDKFKSSIGALKDEEGYMIPIAIRDKFFLSVKLLGNHIIENTMKAAGKEVRLPVTPALQLLAAVDERSGLRAFMTVRANDLLVKNLLDPAHSKLDWTQRKAMVKQQLEDQLFQATPSKQNIADFREEYGLDDTTISDEQISRRIAAERVGAPVLRSPEQQAAYAKAEEMRMLKKPEGWLGSIDKGIMEARENPYVDALIPYWRAPMSSALWEIKFASPPILETVDQVFNRLKGTPPTDAEVSKVVATWYAWLGLVGGWTALQAAGAIEGSISSDPRLKAQGKAAGRVPNSIGGIPGLGAVPILKTLFMYSDLQKAVEQGFLSDYDAKNAYMGLWQVFAGQLLRETGFKQFNELYSSITSQDPAQWNRFAGFMLGGQLNPASGLLRQVERIGAVQGPDLYPPRYDRPGDAYLRDQAGIRQPWHDTQQRLEGLLFNLAPSLSGQPKKETDYLGRQLRRFEGIRRGEWPVGMPGLWDSPVHAELERLQMLQPPTPLMDGRLKGLPMTSELEVEFNDYLAKPSPYPMSEDPDFTHRMKWRPAGSTGAGSVDLRDLLDRVTAGKTQYEALNLLFNSESWKAWERDPQMSTDPRVADAPRAVVMQRIGPKAVKLISDYYSELATEQVMQSTTPAAREWQQLWTAKQQQLDPERGAVLLDRVQGMTR